jgi:hypothetical protein
MTLKIKVLYIRRLRKAKIRKEWLIFNKCTDVLMENLKEEDVYIHNI